MKPDAPTLAARANPQASVGFAHAIPAPLTFRRPGDLVLDSIDEAIAKGQAHSEVMCSYFEGLCDCARIWMNADPQRASGLNMRLRAIAAELRGEA